MSGDLGTPGSAIDFETLYRENFTFVVRSARRLGVQPAWIDDVAQEVFVVAARRLHEFEGRSKVRTWLFSITFRAVQSHRRWSKRHDRRRDALAREPSRVDDPYPRAHAADMLVSLLDTLPDKYRTVFILGELEGMTSAQIAQGLGLNPNTTYSRLREARKRMAQAVADLRASEERLSA
ncbi:MAG: sigma-70 family RNA polymerase sigma factor [Myxococcota bacterium]